MHRLKRFLPCLLSSFLAGGAGAQEFQAPLRLLPQDTLAFYYAEPGGGAAGSAATVEWLLRGMRIVGQMGRFSDRTRLIADLIGCLPLLGRYPHTVALLDIQSNRLAEEVYRLGSLQAVLILHSRGDNESIEGQLRGLLNSHTNSDLARLEQVSHGDVTVHRLVDSRLPDWAVVEWAVLGEFFVVGVGQGALGKVLAAAGQEDRRLTEDRWFTWAYGQCRAGPAGTMWLVRIAALRGRLERVVRGRPLAVIEALGAGGVEQSFWSVGRQGRAIVSFCAQRVAGRDLITTVSDPAAASAELLAAVPPHAPSFAVIRADLSDWVRRLAVAYLASQAPATRERIEEWWTGLQERLQIDVRADLLAQLGGHAVVHTFPEHPWGVPLLCTILFELRGDAERFRVALDRLLAAWQAALSGGAAEEGEIRLGPQLRRSEDGIWHVQIGVLVMLGLAVEDGWVVLSYSPEAVRENLVYLRSRPREPTTLPAGPPPGR